MVPGQQGASFPAPETPARRPLAFSRNVLVAKGNLRLQVLGKFLQYRLTQKIGIEFAGFRKFNNSFGDSFIDKIALIGKLKSYASHFECDAHDLLGLGIEFGAVQKLRDGHDPSPTIGSGTLCRSCVSIR